MTYMSIAKIKVRTYSELPPTSVKSVTVCLKLCQGKYNILYYSRVIQKFKNQSEDWQNHN